jgi:hypothetical protein
MKVGGLDKIKDFDCVDQTRSVYYEQATEWHITASRLTFFAEVSGISSLRANEN